LERTTSKFQLTALTELELNLSSEMVLLQSTVTTEVLLTTSQTPTQEVPKKTHHQPGLNIQFLEKLEDMLYLIQTQTTNNQELFTKKFLPKLKEKTLLTTWLVPSVELEEISKKVSLLTFTKFIQITELDSQLLLESHSTKLECDHCINKLSPFLVNNIYQKNWFLSVIKNLFFIFSM
jgi:hypothetical protein